MFVATLRNSLTAKLLLAFASTVILSTESHGTHDRVLLSGGSGILQGLSDPLYLWLFKADLLFDAMKRAEDTN
jgi:hypothetical protein